MSSTESPPFVRHHRTAKALVLTFKEALEPQFIAKGALTREEFAHAVTLMIEHWPKALPLFAHTCRACAGMAAPVPEAPPPRAFKPDGPDGRRRDFVTRLIFSTVVTTLPETSDPLTGLAFPQVIAPGLQANLAALFYDKEWEALNAAAVMLYRQIGSDRDEEVWACIAGQETLAVLADTLFVRVALRFKQFNLQRQAFVRRMIDALRERRFDFTDDHFDALFDAMFGRLRGALGSELDRARLDVHYGDGAAEQLMRIFDQFDKRRLEQVATARAVASHRTPRPMLAQRSMPGAPKRRFGQSAHKCS